LDSLLEGAKLPMVSLVDSPLYSYKKNIQTLAGSTWRLEPDFSGLSSD